ncbi:glycosyltransferase family 2 protein [Solicola sp. PLA-1-18]|uniref:glycosyltransferase family 2 protein n=1 Tax=Solicola sp. PLA-1-18 TaxID=3380532 RepID=UPI003B764717
MTRTTVVTIARGRLDHLALQLRGLARGSVVPDEHVVVSMGDPDVTAAARTASCTVVGVPVDGELPLSRARNVGVRTALDGGADVVVLLDVDCVPGPDLVRTYRDHVASGDPALWCGTVAYLPPPPDGGYDLATLGDGVAPHAARPAPAAGEVLDGDHRLFWSLSFAVDGPTWDLVGGFDEGYSGYGGEDTDVGQRARAAGVPLRWLGGAPAFHQHHPTSTPPVQHVRSIVANATRFHARWGWWPMEGWLEAMATQGLVRHVDDTWLLTAP